MTISLSKLANANFRNKVIGLVAAMDAGSRFASDDLGFAVFSTAVAAILILQD